MQGYNSAQISGLFNESQSENPFGEFEETWISIMIRENLDIKLFNESTLSSTPSSSQILHCSDSSELAPSEEYIRQMELLRKQKIKKMRFNAQSYFSVIPVDDGKSKRYQCIICGHLTKPNVLFTALSQHFRFVLHKRIKSIAFFTIIMNVDI